MAEQRQVMVVGTGPAGLALAQEIQAKDPSRRVILFSDEGKVEEDRCLEKSPKASPRRKPFPVVPPEVDQVVVVLSSADTKKTEELLSTLRSKGLHFKLSPHFSTCGASQKNSSRDDIDLRDLLGRPPISIDLKESLDYLRGERVLVTGAGGSIGGELLRQLASFAEPAALYLLGHGENSIYQIDREIRELMEGLNKKIPIIPLIGNVKDEKWVISAMRQARPGVVFHCAAHKHVSLTESNPVEGIRNNVMGTRHVLTAAKMAGTSRVVLISTDKAVDPVCIYGVSKKLSEMLFLAEAERHDIDALVVRFGNVLGTRGSVVPLFKKQIEEGGPLTITDPEMERYFMTLPEAASLLLQAVGVGQRGGLYLLEMGQPIKIIDLAQKMIHLYNRVGQIPIKVIGLRPGEKKQEFLFSKRDHEEPQQTSCKSILRVARPVQSLEEVAAIVKALEPICFLRPGKEAFFENSAELRKLLKRHFPLLEEFPEEKLPPVSFSQPSISAREEEALLVTLRSGWLTSGRQVEAFEKEFAALSGSSFALAVNSATAGLHLVLKALGVGRGDKVITTVYTFTATAGAIHQAEAEVLFADIEEETLNIDPDHLERLLQSPEGASVKAIIVVHIAGHPCRMDRINELAASYGVAVVEDAAHSVPGGENFPPCRSDAAVYSFYASKNITTGEGGMVTTNRKDLAQAIRIMRLHGIDQDVWTRETGKGNPWEYDVVTEGYKCNMSDLVASIGRVQLERCVEFQQERARIAEIYRQAFSGEPFFTVPPDVPGHRWHLFILRLVLERLSIHRDRFMDVLKEQRVGVSIHFKPLHMFSYYRDRYRLTGKEFPVATRCFQRVLSLPIYPGLAQQQIDHVVESVLTTARRFGTETNVLKR